MHMQLSGRTNTVLATLTATVLACLMVATVTVPPVGAAEVQASAEDGAAAATQDVIFMRDGRELTGKIISESAREVVFRYVDPVLNLQSTITLDRRDILEIKRDLPAEPAQGDSSDPLDDAGGEPVERSRPTGFARGMAEGDADDESLPAFYVIPMKGQMGTDIRSDVYKGIVDDIRNEQPDVVIWVMECADVDELMISMSDDRERGIMQLYDDYRELVRVLHDELRGIRQVMWVHDSVGISSLMALAWKEMYMTPDARLSGFRAIYEMAAAQGDADVSAKMVAAWIGFVNGFLVRGERALELGEAMSRPHHRLSATWVGREVKWHLDTSGEYIVNDSDKRTAQFRAKAAEDFGISNGTAETIDDLALLLGYREYRVIEGGAEKEIKDYVENWRRTYENAIKYWIDFETHMGWATGADTLRYLGRARNDIGRIIASIKRYPAIELRFMQEVGIDLFRLQVLEEDLRERIRAMNQGGGRGGGGGGGGGRGPVGR